MKKTVVSIKLGRKKAAPVNVAAKSLREGRFKQKVEKNPMAYNRKAKHKAAPIVPDGADEPRGED